MTPRYYIDVFQDQEGTCGDGCCGGYATYRAEVWDALTGETVAEFDRNWPKSFRTPVEPRKLAAEWVRAQTADRPAHLPATPPPPG
jgi:hypothetical protein